MALLDGETGYSGDEGRRSAALVSQDGMGLLRFGCGGRDKEA